MAIHESNVVYSDRMASPAPSKFHTEERVIGSAIVISLHGELDIKYGSRATDGFNRALDRHPTTLAADLRDLTFMDSTGIHALLAVRARCRMQGARFVIIRGTAAVDRLLSLAGLDREFDIISSPEQLSDDVAPLAISA